MSNFIKPATLTVPKEVEEFLDEVWEYCEDNDLYYFSEMMEIIVNKDTMSGIEITYED